MYTYKNKSKQTIKQTTFVKTYKDYFYKPTVASKQFHVFSGFLFIFVLNSWF